VLCIRIAWSLMVVQYHSLSLFIESLVEKQRLFSTRQKILISTSSLFTICLLALSFISVLFPEKHNALLEKQIIGVISQYCVFPVLFLSLFITISKLRNKNLPRLLQRQTTLFIRTMIVPFFVLDLVQIYPFCKIKDYIGNHYAFAGLSTLVLVYAIFYCGRKIIGFRFLNIRSHARQTKRFRFLEDFRLVLEQFSNVTNIQELQHITKTFFHQAFSVPAAKTHLYIISEKSRFEATQYSQKTSLHEKVVETFLHTQTPDGKKQNFLKKNKILFTDEVAFNQFYSKKQQIPLETLFLQQLDADAFIPILNEKLLIGYIVIDRHARLLETRGKQEFYGETERDYMLVFVDYLRNIISLLHNKNFNNFLCKEKKLEQKVYLKHQEINQYKESVQSFLSTSYDKTGIIFYKNRRFTYGNRNAQELIPINLNTQNGHPTTKTLKQIAQQVLKYKTTQTSFIKCPHNERLVVSGIPNTEKNNVILLTYYPEISDLLQKKIELLHDPSNWNFLLWLETTKIGEQINQLIPGSGEILLNFKIHLLKLSLGKSALLLDAPADDLPSLVQLIHRISLREQIHTIQLQKLSSHEAAIKIFGINPMLGFCCTEIPLLEKLENGTLFIQDVDLLDIQTQQHLASFMKYGMYKRLQSDRKTPSNVRIICSTTKNLRTALQEGILCKPLFDELNQNFLSMPSLVSLDQQELTDLICTLLRQAIRQEIFDGLLELNNREKKKLIDMHPSSLKELRAKIKQIITEKSKRHAIGQEEEELFHPAYTISDPDLVEASRLGKHALRDPRIMQMLWQKFKNQNKIALFLGVNRSSVNRRCKKYGLM